MAQYLADLLQAKQPEFSRAISDLEKLSGHQSLDNKLLGTLVSKSMDKATLLNLDPHDLHPRELYQALLRRIERDDLRLAAHLNITDPHNVQDVVHQIVRFVPKIEMPKTAWVLKRSVAREMIRQNPPKNVMKLMGYRSVDSMLRRANIYEIFGALRFAESSEWLQKFNSKYDFLTARDFTTRQIQILTLDKKIWGDISKEFIKKKRHNITHSKELGVVYVLPVDDERMPGATIKLLPLILHYIYEIRLYSSFFKLIQLKNNFGAQVGETLNAEPSKVAILGSQHVHWRVIQRYFGKLPKEEHPELFEPHVQPEDLHWRKAEEILFNIDPSLTFWRDMDYVGQIYEGEVVTFNMMDVALSFSNELAFSDRYLYHFRESLWNELLSTYIGQENLKKQILLQLDNDLIEPEDFAQVHAGLEMKEV